MLNNGINYNIIHKVIEIGRTELLPDNFNSNNTWWLSVYHFNQASKFHDLSDDALECFFKGILLTEKATDRYMGSTTNTGTIYHRLKHRLNNSRQRFNDIRDFAKLNRPDNPYAPAGGPLF